MVKLSIILAPAAPAPARAARATTAAVIFYSSLIITSSKYKSKHVFLHESL
jgi:uncharacterized membrane protein YfcA